MKFNKLLNIKYTSQAWKCMSVTLAIWEAGGWTAHSHKIQMFQVSPGE